MFNYQNSNFELIDAVWRKGNIIQSYNSNIWRKDDYGNAIKYSDYGNRNSEYGWEIDHIVSVAKGGSDMLSNLRPLYWRKNVSRN